jgi:ubiquinone/menaquinone biosynthesis C-methylase UbiE
MIGKVAGRGGAYAYHVRSVQSSPAPERIAQVMREAGRVGVEWIGKSGGIVTIHVGTVPPRGA